MNNVLKIFSRKYLGLLGILVLALLLIQCANTNGLQFIDGNYLTKKEPYNKVIVLPLNEKLKIVNSYADSLTVLQNEFPSATSREKEVFDNYLKILIKEKTQSQVLNIEQNINLNNSKLRESKAVIQNQKISFILPDIKDILPVNEKIDYIISFDDVNFSKNYTIDGSSLGRTGEGTYILKIGFEYLIWDCKKNKVASYGRITQKAKLLLVPQKEDFVFVLDKLVDMLVEKSPFTSKKIYF